ncbi:hypothetical protein GCM10022403_054470 [Streptomyces coacervatus]|uniref:Uncharacterized protein n=1 Tax=Streptomyces coacervatus TaxID=647381 RepID=A0ABP7IAZ5_9ACTN
MSARSGRRQLPSTAQQTATAGPRTDTPRRGPDPRRDDRRDAHPHRPRAGRRRHPHPTDPAQTAAGIRTPATPYPYP